MTGDEVRAFLARGARTGKLATIHDERNNVHGEPLARITPARTVAQDDIGGEVALPRWCRRGDLGERSGETKSGAPPSLNVGETSASVHLVGQRRRALESSLGEREGRC